MNLVQRVQDILLRPKETWPQIAAEPATTASIYREYLVYLAAIPAVAGFIGAALVAGFPIVMALVQAVVGYALALLMVWVLSLVADALAPHFGGRKDAIGALKLLAYGSTASFLGGIFSLLPALSLLGLLAALYSIYLLYTGVTVMMKVPADKAVAYTAVLVVCGIVAGIVLGALTGMGMSSAPTGMPPAAVR